MKRVIALANQKGGVGKTTTAVNLAASLTATKRRVLLIDLDPQGNATMGCGVDKHAQSRTSCEVMLGDCAAMEALVPVDPVQRPGLVSGVVAQASDCGAGPIRLDVVVPVRAPFNDR